jgi:SAM-dependent methyltransferase
MISDSLLQAVACPVCLEPEGCRECARTGGHDSTCGPYASRAACACGGPDKVQLSRDGAVLACACCGARYPVAAAEGWLDLVPRTSVGEVTQYADHEFHERLHVTEAEPVLSARVKADMMRRMLGAAPGETVLDLGCGAGKMALYAAQADGRAAGLDVAPFFLPRAAREVDLVLGDLRRLPFRKGSFPRAYSLDVLEHLDEPGVREVLLEARRTLGPRGRLFVYTHAMESSRLASFQRAVNRWPAVSAREGSSTTSGRRCARATTATPSAAMSTSTSSAPRPAEGRGAAVLQRRVQGGGGGPGPAPLRAVAAARREDGNARPRLSRARDGRGRGGDEPSLAVLMAVAHALTWLLKLDVVLFGGVRTGPFFGLLVPRERA